MLVGVAMDSVLGWGLEVIRSVQTVASPGLTTVMKLLTMLGSEYFYLLFLPIMFWCVDERNATRFGLVFIASSFANSWLKFAFAQPRPYELDPAVGMSVETSYGLPSGHSQHSATFWGLLAPRMRKPWGLVLAILLPLAIGFSRIYLGVHFPTDVIAGLVLGWGFALAWLILGDRVERLVAAWNVRVRVVLIAVLALGMNALNMQDTSMSGVFFGTALGAVVLFDKVHFDASSGSLARKAVRLALGLVGMALIYVGGKLVGTAAHGQNDALIRFTRYGLVGAWVSLGAPWLFMRLNLAGARPGKE